MKVIRKPLVWTPALDAFLKQLLADDLTLHLIEQRMGLFRATIVRRMAELGLEACVGIPGQPPREEDLDRMLELYDQGLPLDEIARQMKRPREALERRLKAILERRRLRAEMFAPEPTGQNIVEASRNLLKARGATDRQLDIMGQDAVMRWANSIRKAEGRPQLGRKPGWIV